MHNVVIIGGGVAGLTAGIYAARSNLSPILIEGMQPGGQLTITSDVENYPGFSQPIAGPELMMNMRAQAERLGLTIKSGEVASVNLNVRPFTISVGNEVFETKTIIAATGASAMWLGLESEETLRGKGVSACATCDGFFFKNKHVIVVGGGDTAMEEANYLTHFAQKVTVVHRRDSLRASKTMQERSFNNRKIEFVWNSVVDEILGSEGNSVTGVRLKNVQTNEMLDISCDGVFIAIGHKPNTNIFKGQLEMNDSGYIITKKTSMETSVPGVFAAGDCQDDVYRQATTASGTGCMAAVDADRYLQCM